jgi:hypothetical protein
MKSRMRKNVSLALFALFFFIQGVYLLYFKHFHMLDVLIYLGKILLLLLSPTVVILGVLFVSHFIRKYKNKK